MTITALVLAAGRAARFGRPKQVEWVDGCPLILHALAAATPADDVLVLLGAHANLVSRALRGLEPRPAVAVVPSWHRGIGHVLASGVKLVPATATAVVILLADQPGVTQQAVQAVCDAWRRTGAPWVCAGYSGRQGHPHLFDMTYFEVLATLDGDIGARAITTGRTPLVIPVAGNDSDIDDERDLAEWRARHSSSPTARASSTLFS